MALRTYIRDTTGWRAIDGSAPVVLPPTNNPPSAVGNLQALVNGSRVTLSWQPATDSDGTVTYRVLQDGVLTGGVLTTTALVINGVPDGSHTFSVYAVDDDSAQGPVSTANATTPSVSSGFPDASNTGIAGVGLTRAALTSSGGISANTPGQIIENKDITGGISVNAANVTIRNCYIQGTGLYTIVIREPGCVIQDCTIVGNANVDLACIGVEDAGQYVIQRCDISQGGCGAFLPSDSGIEDSFLHNPGYVSGNHTDMILTPQAPVTGSWITGNTILNPLTQTSCAFIGDDRIGANEILVQGNSIAGAGYSLYCGPGQGLGIRVVGNAFSTLYYPECGFWGRTYNWISAGNTWAGNYWLDGPNSGQPVLPNS